MKQISIIIVALISLVGISYAQEQNTTLKGKIKVQVDGLSCPFCAYGLEKKLKTMEGVAEIKIDVENAFALLTIEEGKTVTEAAIRENVKKAGFTSREITEVTDDE
ncbi:MAG: heavy-metal-associated domain-containing protein [Cyclobacteriaceae bacterium]